MINDPEIIGEATMWDKRQNMDIVRFPYGLALVHRRSDCVAPCAIHAPTDHHMRHLPTMFRSERGLVERICSHQVGHPDPDQVTHWQQTLSPIEALTQSLHGCCEYGCCKVAIKEEDEG